MPEDKQVHQFAFSARRHFKLWTPEELAIMLRVEPNTVVAWRRDNTGPKYTRLGRGIFYRDADIETWINENIGRSKFNDGEEA